MFLFTLLTFINSAKNYLYNKNLYIGFNIVIHKLKKNNKNLGTNTHHIDEISSGLSVAKHGREVGFFAVRDGGRDRDLRVRIGQALVQVLCYFYLY